MCAKKVDYSRKTGQRHLQYEKLHAIKKLKSMVEDEKNMAAIVIPNLDQIMTVI